MIPFAIGGLQLTTSGLRDNLPYISAKLDYFMYLFPWVQMVVFSELAAYGPNPAKAEPLPGPAERKFQEMAAKHHIWIADGLLTSNSMRESTTRFRLSIQQANRSGYRKMFPFLPYEEGTTCGNSFFVFDVPDVGRFWVLSIHCGFPESYVYSALGAEVILHPTLTTTIRRDV